MSSDWQDHSERSGEAAPGPAGGYGAGPAPAAGPPPEALAGFWIRFAGALVDGLILGAVSGVLAGALGGESSALGVIVGGAYFTYLHATPAGQSVGNLVAGIRVVDADTGRHLEYSKAFLRWLMSYVSGIALLIGYLWMLGDRRNQTWHDKVANSLVVRVSHYPPPAPFGKSAG